MYFGPLKWPPLWIWIAAVAVTLALGVGAVLGVSPIFPAIIVTIVVLVVAVPRRLKDLGADEMRESRPDD